MYGGVRAYQPILLRFSDACVLQSGMALLMLLTFLMEMMAAGTPLSSVCRVHILVQRRYHIRGWLCLRVVEVRLFFMNWMNIEKCEGYSFVKTACF
jgi:hypothetical protein